MQLNKLFFSILGIVAAFMLDASMDLLLPEMVSVALFVYFLLSFVDSIGKSYELLDLPILLALFQCLLMPMVIFHFYNNDYFVIALRYDMGVTADTYFSFMLPAVIAMIIGMKFPFRNSRSVIKQFFLNIDQIKTYLKGKGNLGLLLSIIGFVSGFLQVFIPGELNYVAYLFGKLLYVGILYTYFSDAPNRKILLIGGLVTVLAQSLVQGMFGELVYTSVLSVMLLLLGQKISGGAKTAVVIVGMLAIFLLQSVKKDYRDVAWYGKGEQGKTEAFFSLLSERITNPSQFFDKYNIFPMVNRFNQGMIIGKVMVHIPAQAPYAGGETIFKSLAASFVPRLLWPDKPIAGGKQNMERFTGFIIEGYSMNIGPMGEAYGNFGSTGGIIFMFIYGLFFSFSVYMILRVAKKHPTIILWFPILFLNSVQVETDILMCVNSLIKNCIFIWFCYWGADRFLRLKL